MNKEIDAVKIMRDAREKLSKKWITRENIEIDYLEKKYGVKTTGKYGNAVNAK